MLEAMMADFTALLGVPAEVILGSPFALAVGFHAISRQTEKERCDALGRSADFQRVKARMNHGELEGEPSRLPAALGAGTAFGLAIYLGTNPDILRTLIPFLPPV
jgi:hypothetical protein